MNAGLLEKTAGTGTSAITPKIQNTGAIVVTSGTLDVPGRGDRRGNGDPLGPFDPGVRLHSLCSYTIDFAGGRSAVDPIDPHGFSGHIENFASPDAVDLSGDWVFSAFSENSGGTLATLTLASGATHLSLDFIGDYTKHDFSIASGTTTTITHARHFPLRMSYSPTAWYFFGDHLTPLFGEQGRASDLSPVRGQNHEQKGDAFCAHRSRRQPGP